MRNIKNRKLRKFLWEARRCLVILTVYAVLTFLAIFAVCLVLGLPEIIGNLIFG